MEKKAEELGITLYQTSFDHDLKLFKWWTELQNSKDFETLFTNSHRSLSKFLNEFKSPCMLAFTCDSQGDINHAIWFTGYADSPTAAFVGFWAREGVRYTRHAVEVTSYIYSLAFTVFKTLIGITKHESLLRIHRKLGYNIVGQIPNFLEGEDSWIVYLTEDNFKNSKLFQLKEKL